VDDEVVTDETHYDYTATEKGTALVRAAVTDGELTVACEWMTTIIDTVTNRAPRVLETEPTADSLEVTIGETIRFSITATDPNGDDLFYEFSVDDLVVNEETHYDYFVEREGVTTVRVVVSDGELSVDHEWIVAGQHENRPPEITGTVPSDPAPDVIVGETIRFSVVASDPDDDEMDYTFFVDGAAVSQDTYYDHSAQEEGIDSVRVVVSDGEFTADYLWLLAVQPDAIPPAEVQIVSVRPGSNMFEIEARWLAVGDDGLNGHASSYIVGISDTYIDDTSHWAIAAKHSVDGTTIDPGTEMQLVVMRNSAAQYTAVTVRAIDDAGNVSALGTCVEGYARGYFYGGEVRDASTNEPIAGAVVRGGDKTAVTGPDGTWLLGDMPFVIDELFVSDDDVPGSIGDYYDVQLDAPEINVQHFVIPLIPYRSMQSTIHTDFLQFFDGLSRRYLYKWPSYLRHFELPIDVYVHPFKKNGLDYEATIERVVENLAADIGFTAFRIVDDPPAVGVECVYRDDIFADSWIPTEWTEDFHMVKGRIKFRTVYSPASLVPFERVIRHELGHAMGLCHSQDPFHLMNGGLLAPQVDTFTQDEVNVMDIIYHYSGYELDIESFVRE
jgi:hypothetical protein